MNSAEPFQGRLNVEFLPWITDERFVSIESANSVPMRVVYEQPDDGYRLCAFLWWNSSYHARTSTEV